MPARHLPLVVELDTGLCEVWVAGVPLEGDALVDLDDGLVEGLGPAHLEGEDGRARLVADTEEVPEAFGGDEGVAGALALEERVGRDRGG